MNSTDQAYQIREKLAALQEALLASSPSLPTILKDIHSKLKNDPDTVTILTNEECSILVQGLKKQTATEIATKAIKKAPKKSLKSIGVDDL